MSTTTIQTIIDAAVDKAQTVFNTNMPTVISFAVGVILLFVLWRFFKKSVKSR